MTSLTRTGALATSADVPDVRYRRGRVDRFGEGADRGGLRCAPGNVGVVDAAEANAHGEAGGGGGADPPRREVRTPARRRLHGPMPGEADDASVMAEIFHAPGDVLLLGAHPLGRKDFVELGVGLRAEPVHEAPEVAVAGVALRAIGQVFRGRRLDRFAALFGEVALEQPVFLEVTRAKDHG